MLDPNTIISRQYVDFKTSSDLIEKFVKEHIEKNNNLPENKKLEIEAKIGYILTGRPDIIQIAQSLINSLSDRDPIIIGSSIKTYIQDYFISDDLISQNFRFQKSELTMRQYLNMLNYLTCKANPINKAEIIKILPNTFSADLILKDQTRISLDLYSKKWSVNNKKIKNNLDIIHKGNPYRISCSIEETYPFEGIKSITGVNLIRIKYRTSFQFQYMRYDLTDIVELVVGNNPLKTTYFERLNMILTDQDIDLNSKIDNIWDFYTKAKLEKLETYEAEVEIHDLTPFIENLNKPLEFGGLFKRFLRNAEALFYMEKELHNQISRGYLQSDERHIPIISEYMTHLYKENIKL